MNYSCWKSFAVPSNWSKRYDEYTKCVLFKLPKNSEEYRNIASKSKFTVKKIVRCENPYLYGQFLLKRMECKSRNSKSSIRTLYHATSTAKINSIVNTNLDWRLSVRCRFGQGVSFSHSQKYANAECSKKNGRHRAMIITNVIVGSCVNGNYDTRLPKKGDTTVGNCHTVFVKYCDNEFYPKYIVYYDI